MFNKCNSRIKNLVLFFVVFAACLILHACGNLKIERKTNMIHFLINKNF